MDKYTCLTQQSVNYEGYEIVPIRDKDKYSIMNWRNDQIKILRQKELLTREKQEWYFKNVVDKLFTQEKPEQILFSFLKDEVLIGYGGLVHIDWESKNAEISFLTATERNADIEIFKSDLKTYLRLIKEVVKVNLVFKKIYSYSYDIRSYLFSPLVESDFVEEARLKEHVFIENKFYDVIIHSCFFNN